MTYKPQHVFAPEDYGLIAWSGDPTTMVNAATMNVAGLIYLVGIRIVHPMTVTNLHININTAGSGLTTGQCFAALYQNNSLLAATADQSTAWASTGLKTMALTSAQSVTPGMIQVGFYYNGTTGPQPMTSGYAFMSSTNLGLRHAGLSGGYTTAPPASVSTQTTNSRAYWAAVS